MKKLREFSSIRCLSFVIPLVSQLGRTIRKVMGGERGIFEPQEFFSLSNSLHDFFRPWHEYFLGLIGVQEFFSFNFPLREYFFGTSPAPHKFSNGPSLIAENWCVIYSYQ